MNLQQVVIDLLSPTGTYYLGDPWRLGEKGLTVLVPIRCKSPPKRNYVLASEAKDKVKLTDSGSINKIKVDNKSGSAVFVRGGTVFKGMAGQDRAVVQGTIVEPTKGEIPIEVKCVHAARSINPGGGFIVMESLAPSKVYDSLRSRNQHAVWSAVANHVAMTQRSTSSYDSVPYSDRMTSDPDLTVSLEVSKFTDFGKQIEEALSKVPDYEDQTGVAVITIDGVQGIELFDSPESWKALGKEVVESYSEIFSAGEVSDLFTMNIDAVKDKVREFLKKVDIQKLKIEDGTFEVENNSVTGEYTNYAGNFIHVILTKTSNISKKVEPFIIPTSPSYTPYPSRYPRTMWRTNDWQEWHDEQWRTNEPVPDLYRDQLITLRKKKTGDDLILARLKEKPSTFNDLQSKTNVASSTLARRLNEFHDGGLVEKSDANGHSKWKLTAKGVVCLNAENE